MKSDREIIDELVCGKAADYARDLEDVMSERVLAACESPIERIMAAALFLASWPATDCHDLSRARTGFTHPHWWVGEHSLEALLGAIDKSATAGPLLGNDYLAIAPQQKVLSYRVDFLVVMRSDESGHHTAVVECDGHDFHERTKKQARRDKLRDREMQGLGYAVLRFTGSEIYKDAARCAEQVADHFWEVSRRFHKAQRAPAGRSAHLV